MQSETGQYGVFQKLGSLLAVLISILGSVLGHPVSGNLHTMSDDNGAQSPGFLTSLWFRYQSPMPIQHHHTTLSKEEPSGGTQGAGFGNPCLTFGVFGFGARGKGLSHSGLRLRLAACGFWA